MLLRRQALLSADLVMLAAALPRPSRASTRGQNKAARKTTLMPWRRMPGRYLRHVQLCEGRRVLQITLDKKRVTGYISRMGDSGQRQRRLSRPVLRQPKLQGHDVSFTHPSACIASGMIQRQVHSRPGKNKRRRWLVHPARHAQGPLPNNAIKTSARAHAKLSSNWLAQPEDSDEAPARARSRNRKYRKTLH